MEPFLACWLMFGSEADISGEQCAVNGSKKWPRLGCLSVLEIAIRTAAE